MTTNSKHGRTGKGGAKTASERTRTDPPSLSAFRAGRAVDSLTPPFVQWFDDGSPGAAAAALGCLEQVKAVMGRYMQSTAAADVARLDPVILAEALAAEITSVTGADADEADDAGRAVYVVAAVHAFVDFLAETGRWAGSAEQLAEVIDLLHALAGGGDGVAGYVDVPDIPDEDALRVFSQLPLIKRATALLEWIGDGKPVTATGALRLRDIEPAAACVGVSVKGASKQPGAAVAVDATSRDAVPTVRSMYEVPLLAQLWEALGRTELIETGPTKALPSAATEVFLAGGTSERLQELVFFTDQFLDAAVLGYDPEQQWERAIAGMQASILLAAATANPARKERVLAAPDYAPAEEKMMAGVLTRAAVRGLEELADLGLLIVDTHFRIPPELIRCIANVFDDALVLEDLGLLDHSGLDNVPAF
ncbi:hypothetical protein [Arthrobacter sp. ISL-72]|uniref:hypothetical protein n=1 Tax=Arthrobacter sp. ISL-72 TaxID=2819114 RepID=UPI001BECFECF|nr:hypothetical protein [Arthrobacter sp. ISL-72]MBT2594826.1 hypothetical protein [Arthrobacter sp. ISL-72]